MSTKIIRAIEEQLLVGFTGKLNVLNSENQQILGCIYFSSGEMINTKYLGAEGKKAFYNLCFDDDVKYKFSLITEPEIVDIYDKKITEPFEIIKGNLVEVKKRYIETSHHRPPRYLKLVVQKDFVIGNQDVSSSEFNLLCIMTENTRVEDIYNKCHLLDSDITNALVSLRKKKAIKVIEDNV